MRTPTMSFREKAAWACLITTVAIFVPYFVEIIRFFNRSELTARSVITGFYLVSVWQVLIHVVARLVVVIRSREPKDERDDAIEAKAFRHSYWVFAFFAWIVIMLAPALTPTGYSMAPASISQALILCFVIGETTRYLTQVVSYHRGS